MLHKYTRKNIKYLLLHINFIRRFFNFIILDDHYLHFFVKNGNNQVMMCHLFFFFKKSSFSLMSQLTDIKVDDLTFFSKKYRFKVTYVFLSLYYNTRFFFSFFLKEHENIMDVTELYPSAGFLQREAWDEFGIKFIDYEKKRNIIQRRLLMDYGFKGHPLKKNFPLTGFVEIVYNQEKRRIVMIPLCLLQEYRKFSFKDF